MHELIRSNKRRSALLIVAFVIVLALIGAAFGLAFGGGLIATIIALLIGAAIAFASYWKADKVALAVSRAKPADPEQYARLHNLVEGLCIASGLPKPGVYIVDDPAPNAFATGRNPRHAAIAVTTGLLEKMNRVELEGVVAHELSHIRNYDILVSTLAVTMVGAVALLSDIAIRTMWWNGGRVRRSGDQSDRTNPLALVGFASVDRVAVDRQGDAGVDLAPTRDAGRRQRLPDDPLPARVDLGAREASSRHHGDAFCVHRYGTLVDRTTDEWRWRRWSTGGHSSVVQHPSATGRTHCIVEGTVNRTARSTGLLVAATLIAAACSGGGEDASRRVDVDHGGHHDDGGADHDHVDHVDHGAADHHHGSVGACGCHSRASRSPTCRRSPIARLWSSRSRTRPRVCCHRLV